MAYCQFKPSYLFFIYLCGNPLKYRSLVSGSIDWHHKGPIFVGAGETSNKVLFSYNSNWEAPGSWAIEVSTKNHRYKLMPLEKLYVMRIGELSYEEVRMDSKIGDDYKPGILLMLKNLFSELYDDFCDIDDQIENYVFYNKIQQNN